MRRGSEGSCPWVGRRQVLRLVCGDVPVSTTFLSEGIKPEREKAEPFAGGALASHKVRELRTATDL